MHESVKEKIASITAYLADRGARKVILFGSRAKGGETPRSDIDIAIDLTLDHRSARKIKEEVDELAGIYSVDLLFLDKIDNAMRHTIEKEGVVLYEKE
ncbi:nucleotidyltransferase family protein [Hydrogenimonas sp.]